MSRSMLSSRAAALAAPSCQGPVDGSRRRATRRTRGTAALMSSSHFPVRPGWSRNNPVTFPPGRARLRTYPAGDESGDVSAGVSEAADEAGGDRVDEQGGNDDRNLVGGRTGRLDPRTPRDR